MADLERVGLILCFAASLAPMFLVTLGVPISGAWSRAVRRLWLPVVAGAPAAPATLLEDTFSDLDGVYLDDHAPDVAPLGSAWAFITTPDTFEIRSNQAKLNYWDGYCDALIDAGATDVVMQLTITTGDGSDDYAELLLRYDAASGDYVAVGISKSGLFYLV